MYVSAPICAYLKEHILFSSLHIFLLSNPAYKMLKNACAMVSPFLLGVHFAWCPFCREWKWKFMYHTGIPGTTIKEQASHHIY